MKKIAIFVLVLSFFSYAICSAYAQQKVKPQATGLEKSIISMQSKISKLDGKIEDLLANQEKILEELKVLKIRIRRN